MADNGLSVNKEDIWQEILRHVNQADPFLEPNDINFFYLDPYRLSLAGPDGRVYVESEGPCAADRIQITLNSWALAVSSTLSKQDLDRLLNDEKEHFFEGLLHPTAAAPVKPSFATFIRNRASTERHFEYERAIPLCANLAPQLAGESDVIEVEGRYTVRGRYYVTDDSGDCTFAVKTIFYTNGDQRNATLTLDGTGNLSGDVTSPIAGATPSASAAQYNTVPIGRAGPASVTTR